MLRWDLVLIHAIISKYEHAVMSCYFIIWSNFCAQSSSLLVAISLKASASGEGAIMWWALSPLVWCLVDPLCFLLIRSPMPDSFPYMWNMWSSSTSRACNQVRPNLIQLAPTRILVGNGQGCRQVWCSMEGIHLHRWVKGPYPRLWGVSRAEGKVLKIGFGDDSITQVRFSRPSHIGLSRVQLSPTPC